MRWLDGVLARGFVRGFAATLLLAALVIRLRAAAPVLQALACGHHLGSPTTR